MAIAAMADALVRAGLINEEKVLEAQNQHREARKEYSELSTSISKIIRDKRQIQDLQSLAKRAEKSDDFFTRVKMFVEIAPLNLANPSNQKLVQDMLQGRINELETKLKPIMTLSRKLETKFGFERPKKKSR
jgi:hypothetical protein